MPVQSLLIIGNVDKDIVEKYLKIYNKVVKTHIIKVDGGYIVLTSKEAIMRYEILYKKKLENGENPNPLEVFLEAYAKTRSLRRANRSKTGKIYIYLVGFTKEEIDKIREKFPMYEILKHKKPEKANLQLNFFLQ